MLDRSRVLIFPVCLSGRKTAAPKRNGAISESKMDWIAAARDLDDRANTFHREFDLAVAQMQKSPPQKKIKNQKRKTQFFTKHIATIMRIERSYRGLIDLMNRF